jgi:enoyl-CoA hydratase
MTLSVELDDEIAVIALDRQPQRNALDDVTMRELADAFAAIDANDDVRALVLTARGDKAFCAGVDLGAFAARRPTGPGDDWYALDPLFRGAFPKPIVAAVNGVAVAAGLELLLACDVIVAAEHASFGIPEVKRGLVAAGGGTDLPRRLPMAIALEMGLTGERISAERAYSLGLINRVLPAGEVFDEAVRLARLIAANGPYAVRLTKELMYATQDLSREEIRTRAHEAGHLAGVSDDALEGATAFIEKRAPKWTGK